MNRIFAIAFLAAVVFASCRYVTGKRINGNGNVISQSRSFSGFTGVEVSSSIHLYVKQDSGFSVKVETDENLQQHIIINQDGSMLRIKQEDNTNLDATGKLKVYVSAPLFKSLKASGACHLIGENQLSANDEISVDVSGASEALLELKAPKVTTEMTGASKLKLKGQTRDLYIDGSGASGARCYELLSENAYVEVSGASSAEVFASVKIEAKASGASDIRYKGAANYTGNASGAGSIKKVE